MDDKMVVKTAVRVSTVSIISNIILSLLKLIAGIVGRSMAMLSDAIHSLSDVFGSIIVIIGVKMSKKEEDRDHQYGHDRMECLASLALGAILFLTGTLLIYEGIKKIYVGEDISTPGTIALIAAIVSIVAKEGMYWYTKIAADKIHSDALRAEAWHHRSDALSSIGSLIGVAGAMLGVKILDPVMAGIIGLVIIKVSYDIVKEAVDKMVDKACDDETVRAMEELVLNVEGVEGLDLIKTRMFGTKMYVDIEISADGDLLLKQSHEIAEAVHDNIEKQFADVKHCTVHVNPAGYEHKKLP
ncbi:MAG: cation transporter [Eubacterium sp.]|jgi:cation diffusion facilitator family transporter|nr:cation transporter [Eubacterium sp.]